MRKIGSKWTLVCAALAVAGCSSSSLKLEAGKKNYRPGEEIKVSFKTPSGFASNAWVGIIPSNIDHGSEAVNDSHDLTYQYLSNRVSGVLTFAAPYAAGEYDFRLNDTDSNGKERASVSFKVEGEPVAVNATLNLEGNKTAYAPGEEIRLNFTAAPSFPTNAWVGLIPSGIAHGDESLNDQHDIAYQYLSGRSSGVLSFTAPSQPGNYDLRMNDTDSNGREVASISFKVEGTSTPVNATLNIEGWKASYAPGEVVLVSFNVSGVLPASAWVGVIPSTVNHGSEPLNDEHDIAYQYLSNRASGTLTFSAPAQVGQYDFRLNDTDSNGVELASVSFNVAK